MSQNLFPVIAQAAAKIVESLAHNKIQNRFLRQRPAKGTVFYTL